MKPGRSRCDRDVNEVSAVPFPQPVVLQPQDFRGRIAFHTAATEVAAAARARLVAHYGEGATEAAAAIVSLGGDGCMLETQHRWLGRNIPIYGMNCGSVGFLMNDYREDGLEERLGGGPAARPPPPPGGRTR